MRSINIYSVKQVKDKGGLYDLHDTLIKSPGDANDIIQTVLDLSSEAVEKFGILSLNARNEVIGIHILSIGSLCSAIVHPRSVFQAAILNNAASIILFHNHPSGDPTPSERDIELSRRLVEAGDLMAIPVVDHIITGDDDYCSLRSEGLM